MNQAKIAGGRRIKQNKRKNKQVISSESHENYLKSITILNEKILNMKDNDYIKFRDFSTQLVDAISKELKRIDFKDRKEFRIFKEDRLKFLYSKLFTPKNNVKIIIDSSNFQYITKTFSKCGIETLEKLMSNLHQSILNRTYDQKDENKEYNAISFNESCSILDIDVANKILFSTVKKQYEIKLKDSIDDIDNKIIINKAFINIRNQYENYLKKIETKIV
jgi:hypothetical protein